MDFWIASVIHTNLFIFKIYDLFSFESIAYKFIDLFCSSYHHHKLDFTYVELICDLWLSFILPMEHMLLGYF